MEEAGDEIMASFKHAAADAVAFNSPLGDDRANALADALAAASPSSVVDLGCGHGAFLQHLASRLPAAALVGVDDSPRAIEAARRSALIAGVEGHVRFEIADASDWSEVVDAAVCIGSSHAVGGVDALFGRLAKLVPHGSAIVGDGIWVRQPSDWCLDVFGPLPDGVAALEGLAASNGWEVVESAQSTQGEWDHFETEWCNGVRSVGTEAAHRFADERGAEYANYRGTLGFGWLILRRG